MLRIASALAGLVCAAALVSPAQAQFDPFRQDPLYANSYGYQQAQPQVQGQPGDEYRAQVAPIPRQLVSFDSKYSPGTIVISTEQRRLFYVTQRGEAISYGVGVGRPGFEWSGVKTITSKREWPSWTPPVEMLRRRPDLPRYMSGGLDNPLGARAMYLGGSLYRIHGSNEPDTIGQAVSSGCIRMTNDDVVDLYGRAKVGTKVVVLR